MRPEKRSAPACTDRFNVTAVVHISNAPAAAPRTGSALIAWLFHLGILQSHENLEAEVHEGENVPSGVSQLAGPELAQTGEAGHGGFACRAAA